MVRCGIALYGCSPFGGDPAEHGPAPGDVAGLLPGVGQDPALPRERRLRAHLARGPRHARGRRPGRLRRRLRAGALRPRPRCSWAAGGCRWWARSRWTSSRWTSGRRARSEVGEEVVLIGAQGPERITRRGGRGPARHDQLRGDLRRGRARAAGSRGVSAAGPLRRAARRRCALDGAPGPWAAGCATRCSAARWPTSTWPWRVTPRQAAARARAARTAPRASGSRARFGAWRVQGGDLRLTGGHHPAPGRRRSPRTWRAAT